MSLDIEALVLLERFRFLTRQQMRDTLGCNADHLGEVLRSLEKRRMIGAVRPGFTPGAGRAAHVHYLQKSGASLVAEVQRRDLETLTWCESTPQLSHDLAHRLACVDVHLWLARILGDALAGFLPYYTMQRTNDGPRHASRLVIDGKAFVPDALFLIEKAGERFGYVLEVQRAKGRAQLRDQLAKHAHSVREKLAAQKLGVDAVAVMYVAEDTRDLKVIRGAALSLAPLRGCLFGRTLGSITEPAGGFRDGWEALA